MPRARAASRSIVLTPTPDFLDQAQSWRLCDDGGGSRLQRVQQDLGLRQEGGEEVVGILRAGRDAEPFVGEFGEARRQARPRVVVEDRFHRGVRSCR
jgi:hypothetical protein